MILREATLSDLPAFWEHTLQLYRESGKDGDIIFTANEGPQQKSFEDFRNFKAAAWQKPVTECGWGRCWVVSDGDDIVGDIQLIQYKNDKTTLHQALLMMGIQRRARSSGWGTKLMETALGWAKEQPSLEWIQLNVFAHNEPARKLYKRFGFVEAGTIRDLFRLYGQSLDDISMSLKL